MQRAAKPTSKATKKTTLTPSRSKSTKKLTSQLKKKLPTLGASSPLTTQLASFTTTQQSHTQPSPITTTTTADIATSSQQHSSHHQRKNLHNRHTPLLHQSKRFKRKQREKTLYVTGPYFVTENDDLPVLTGVDYYDDRDPDIAPQYRNTYMKHFQVPCLLSTEPAREQQSKAINASGNKILSSLRQHLLEAKKNKKQFYLTDLPMTPNFAQEANKIYETDPDDYNIPPNRYPLSPHTVDPVENWGQILQVKTDLMDLWAETNPGKSPSNTGPHVSGDSLAVSQVTRVAPLIQNRVKNPELYHTFGLDDSVYHTRLTMYAIHVWLYCRAVQYRPVYQGPSYRTSLIKALDSTTEQALYYDFRFLNASDRHQMIQSWLPYYRSFMINLDKSFTALVAGDPEPLYGILYRGLYRPNEANRHDPKSTDPLVDKEALRGLPYSPDLEVFMQQPPSITHMNNLINYMVNASYDFQTKSPRDVSMLLNGFMEMVDFKHYGPKSNKPVTPVPKATNTPAQTDAQGNEAPVVPRPAATTEIHLPESSTLVTPPPAPVQPSPMPTIIGSSVPITAAPAPSINTEHIKAHKNSKLLNAFTPDEMMRWCYPVYQASTSPYVPGFFKRISLRLNPPKANTNNWFLAPRGKGEPAWRPPTCSLTVTGRKM